MFYRSFLQTVLPKFAASNAQLEVEVLLRPQKAPTLTAVYGMCCSVVNATGFWRSPNDTYAADGTSKVVDVKRRDANYINTVAQRLRDATTATIRDLAKPVISPRPSVQGVWSADLSYPSFTLREAKGAAQPTSMQ